MVSSGEKYYRSFVGYTGDDDYKIKPLRIMLPKTSAYVKSYDGETNQKMYSVFKRMQILYNTRNYLCGLGKKPVQFYDISIFIKIKSFHFSQEAFSNLHCFILTNFILNTLNGQIIKSVATIIEIMKLNCRYYGNSSRGI